MRHNIWVRTIVAVIIAEALPIVALVGLVAAMSSGDAAADKEIAASMGLWVGPIGGAIATFLLAWWALRPLRTRRVAYGALIGFLVATLDAGVIFAAGEPMQPMM